MKEAKDQRQVVATGDGSHTVYVPGMNVTYHSKHGAVQESLHVFLKAGLEPLLAEVSLPLRIFEMGFGTGLNAFLTALEAQKRAFPIHYTAIERFPLSGPEWASLNYSEVLGEPALFEALHRAPWNEEIPVTPHFTLQKVEGDLLDFRPVRKARLVYYDAFAPSAQPELWTPEAFRHLASFLEDGAVLVTYCSKGDVRRAFQSAGFTVEKLPGPPGKREMVRARFEPRRL